MEKFAISDIDGYRYSNSLKGFDVKRWKALLLRPKGMLSTKNSMNLLKNHKKLKIEEIFRRKFVKLVKNTFWQQETIIPEKKRALRNIEKSGRISDEVFYNLTGLESIDRINPDNIGVILYLCDIFKIDIDKIYKEIDDEYNIEFLMKEL